MFCSRSMTRPCPPAKLRTVQVAAIASPLNSSKGASNGGGPHRVVNVQTTLDDINKSLAACIKQAGNASSLDKINKGIGQEIFKAAVDRFGK